MARPHRVIPNYRPLPETSSDRGWQVLVLQAALFLTVIGVALVSACAVAMSVEWVAGFVYRGR